MYIVYVVTTLLAAFAVGWAASLNFVGAESVKVAANRVYVSQKWMVPFGMLLTSGAVGLLIGLTTPVLGTAAGIGLVLYFVCAVGAHLRAHDPHVAGAVFFLVLASAALAADVAYRTL
jgi:uncharacterized membrane-anchored protein